MMKSKLLRYAKNEGVHVIRKRMPVAKVKGLFVNRTVFLCESIETEAEEVCILAEEIGHYKTTSGHALTPCLDTDRQEVRARRWAHNELIPLSRFIDCYRSCVRNRFEAAEYLGVTEEFLEECVDHYRQIYGTHVVCEEYVIMFDPLGVMKRFD